jgi:hypothetical protein
MCGQQSCQVLSYVIVGCDICYVVSVGKIDDGAVCFSEKKENFFLFPPHKFGNEFAKK